MHNADYVRHGGAVSVCYECQQSTSGRCWRHATQPAPECSVAGCSKPALGSSPCCYGHTVDADDPAHIDGTVADG